MYCGREIQPSCMSETEYVNSCRKTWHKLEDDKPRDGQTVIVLYPAIETSSPIAEMLVSDVATYCDGFFYQLDYDDRLGVLRKVPLHDKVYAWAKYIIPNWDDEL